MPVQSLKADVRHYAGVAIIELHGEVNGMAEEMLQTAYDEAVRANPSVILLNFQEVNYITSTGVALIVELLGQTRQANRRLATCCLNEHYTKVFQITRLSDFMSVFPDESSALNELSRVKAGS